jgi:hypothetical protein
MTEALTSPLDAVLGGEFQLPVLDDLTEQQRQAIAEGPGWVNEPVAVDLEGFADTDAFAASSQGLGTNNFRGFFRRQGFQASVYENTPAFQRLRILHPDLVEYMDQQLANPDELPEGVWEDLLKVYNIMKMLVDKNDPNVTSDGVVDKLYLTH